MKRFPIIGVFTSILNTFEIPDNRIKKCTTYSSTDMDKMLREMTGKSKLEKKRILKNMDVNKRFAMKPFKIYYRSWYL